MRLRIPAPFAEPREQDRLAELAAMACLEECREALGLEAIPTPVPVEKWIERPLGIDYGFEKMRGLVGYARYESNMIRISDAIEDNDQRVRWTAAHELGHIRLHRSTPATIKPGDPRYAQLYVNPMERQAERFAAAFLLPLPELVHSIFAICREHSFDAEEMIPILLRRSDQAMALWDTVFIPGIGRTFNVTRPGVLFRLGELRLFDGAPLVLPKHMFSLSRPQH